MAKKQIQVGVRQGAGPEPGYQWDVALLSFVFKERKFLNKEQRKHLASEVKELARQLDPTHSDTISIDNIEDFHELRDWGGILDDLNVRIFFGVDKKARAIVVLGVIKKKNNGATLLGDKVRMRRRWRKYLNGDYGQI